MASKSIDLVSMEISRYEREIESLKRNERRLKSMAVSQAVLILFSLVAVFFQFGWMEATATWAVMLLALLLIGRGSN